MRRVALGSAMALLFASSGQAAVPSPVRDDPSHVFGDWLAACDNLLDCRVYGFCDGDIPATLLLLRPRGAAPGAMVILQADRTLRPPGLRLQPGRRGPSIMVRLLPASGGALRGSLSSGEVALLLPALRTAGRITLLLPGPRPGTRPVSLGSIPLAGAAAALDWCLERQHRPPEPLPVVRDAAPFDAAAGAAGPGRLPTRVSALETVRACRRQDADDPATDTASWRLSPAVTLWQVPCGSGNFDRASLFVLDDARTAQAAPAGFTLLPQMAARSAGILVNAETGADGRDITATEPSRGLGDCGDVRSYRWDGTRFHLTLARLMTACRGLEPEDWPVVYRARSG